MPHGVIDSLCLTVSLTLCYTVPHGVIDSVPHGTIDVVPHGNIDVVPHGNIVIDVVPHGIIDSVPHGIIDSLTLCLTDSLTLCLTVYCSSRCTVPHGSNNIITVGKGCPGTPGSIWLGWPARLIPYRGTHPGYSTLHHPVPAPACLTCAAVRERRSGLNGPVSFRASGTKGVTVALRFLYLRLFSPGSQGCSRCP